MTAFRRIKPIYGAAVYALGSLERALLIVETAAREPGLTVTEMAARVGTTKGTAFRHLSVLREWGYLSINDDKRYSLGPRLLELGYTAHDQLALPRVAIDKMRELRDHFNETVHLGVLIDGDVVHIETVPSTQALKMAAAVGERAFAHVSALGKCLLAWGPADRIDTLPDPLPQQSPKSLTTREDLLRDLAAVSARGYALDDEESGVGVRCAGAPIFGADGSVIAAISVSGPADRVTHDRVPAIAEELLSTAKHISERCGWSAYSTANSGLPRQE
jgi:IclR family acetate operon transcriptional repressor